MTIWYMQPPGVAATITTMTTTHLGGQLNDLGLDFGYGRPQLVNIGHSLKMCHDPPHCPSSNSTIIVVVVVVVVGGGGLVEVMIVGQVGLAVVENGNNKNDSNNRRHRRRRVVVVVEVVNSPYSNRAEMSSEAVTTESHVTVPSATC